MAWGSSVLMVRLRFCFWLVVLGVREKAREKRTLRTSLLFLSSSGIAGEANGVPCVPIRVPDSICRLRRV